MRGGASIDGGGVEGGLGGRGAHLNGDQRRRHYWSRRAGKPPRLHNSPLHPALSTLDTLVFVSISIFLLSITTKKVTPPWKVKVSKCGATCLPSICPIAASDGFHGGLGHGEG